MSWNSNWDQTLWCTCKINILLCAHRRSWHTCMHTYAEALWRPPCFYTQVYLHANGPFRDNLITQRRFARSVPLLGENIARAEWKLHFAGANISLGLWKIPFKWSQAEKSQRICLVFCLTVVSAYTAVCFFFFSDVTAHRRVLGTQMWKEGGQKGFIRWNLGLFDCLSWSELLFPGTDNSLTLTLASTVSLGTTVMPSNHFASPALCVILNPHNPCYPAT